MNSNFFQNIYNQCTDFVLILANLFDLSYYEINFIIFCIIYPLTLIMSFVIFVLKKIELERQKKLKSKRL